MGFKVIQFTDGTYITVLGSDTLDLGEYEYNVKYACLAYNKDDVVKTAWVGSKTDLDGNVWTIEPTGRVSINNQIIPMRTNGATVVFIDSSGSNISCYCRYTLPYLNTYQRVYLEHYWLDSVTGQTNDIELHYNEYTNFYSVNLFEGNGIINLFCVVKNGDTTYGKKRTLYDARNGDGRSFALSLFTNSYLDAPSEDNDPYVNGGGASGGGGGTGDFDNTSDTIGLPSLPSLSGLNTGFFTAFVPSASQMQRVSDYLWNNALTDILDPNTGLGEKVDALKKIVANPYDAIMGCSIIPVTPPTAGSKELKMYGLLETGISLPYASSRWVQVDCGTLNIHEFWGSYLDYSPYTKTTSLYLPYIGTVSIDIDLIMSKSIQVVYYVDILSGICVAFILVDGSVKFHYQGQCSTQVPITNADYSSIISAGIGLIGNASQVVGSAVTGAGAGGIGGAVAGAVAGAVSQAPSIASNVMSAKPDIRSGGAIGSSAGILSVQKPYLIIERPKQSVPAFQNHFTGYPSNVTAKVSDLTGYTEFETINLDGIALTDAEKAELDNILKGGVYL